jgi:hypothetical protein
MRLNSSACRASNFVEQLISFCCPIPPHFFDSFRVLFASHCRGLTLLCAFVALIIQPRFVVASGSVEHPSCALRVGRMCSHRLSSSRKSLSTPALE